MRFAGPSSHQASEIWHLSQGKLGQFFLCKYNLDLFPKRVTLDRNMRQIWTDNWTSIVVQTAASEHCRHISGT